MAVTAHPLRFCCEVFVGAAVVLDGTRLCVLAAILSILGSNAGNTGNSNKTQYCQ